MTTRMTRMTTTKRTMDEDKEDDGSQWTMIPVLKVPQAMKAVDFTAEESADRRGIIWQH